jgi:hypothetical protein
MKITKEYLLLSLILLFGFILRIWHLGKQSFWVDEYISTLVSNNILNHGLPLLDSGALYSRAVIFHYTQALFMIFIQNDFTARLASVFFGLATIYLIFLIGKEYNNTVALTAALFTSILFLEVLFSRQARFYQAFQFFFFLTIFLIYKSKLSKYHAFASSISLIILINIHLSGIIIAPISLIVFFKEKQPKYQYIIPIILLLFYGFSALNVINQESVTINEYAEKYSGELYKILRAFSILFIIGIPFAYKKNKKLTLIITIPCLVLFGSLFLAKTFAIRYFYFFIPSIIIFFSVLLSEIQSRNKTLFIIVLLFSIIYPSNLIFDQPVTIIYPQEVNLYYSSEPVLNYKDLSQQTKSLINDSEIICMWSAGCKWYFKKPIYTIPFSMNGLDSGYFIKEGRDVYTNSPVFNLSSYQGYILVEDYFGITKLTELEREKHNSLKESCELIEETNTVKVFRC